MLTQCMIGIESVLLLLCSMKGVLVSMIHGTSKLARLRHGMCSLTIECVLNVFSYDRMCSRIYDTWYEQACSPSPAGMAQVRRHRMCSERVLLR